MGNSGAGAFGVLFVAFLIFIVCRAFVLWYWRVGEAIGLLKSMDEKLGRVANHP
jgi:hypothetical protein